MPQVGIAHHLIRGVVRQAHDLPLFVNGAKKRAIIEVMQRLAELMNGGLGVTTALGKGVMFTLNLPLADRLVSPPAAPSAPCASPSKAMPTRVVAKSAI